MLLRPTVSLGISLLIAVTGCSGAEESDLFGPEANGGASSATDAPATSTDSTTPVPSPGSTDNGSPSDDVDEPAPPAPKDPGSAPDPGTKPVCAAESLDNDEFRKADAFDSCIAGKLVGKEVDYVSIVAPANAKKVFITHTETGGKVAYRMFVNGFTASFTDSPPDEIPAIPNAKYTFKLEAARTTTGDRDWQLEVTFQ